MAGMARADQNIYKYRNSEGGISYSQERSGSGELEAVMRVPATPKTVSKRNADKQLQEDKDKAQALAAERRARQLTQARIDYATQAIALAELALANSLASMPQESDTSMAVPNRQADAEWIRIRALRQSIDLARDQLEQVTTELQMQ